MALSEDDRAGDQNGTTYVQATVPPQTASEAANFTESLNNNILVPTYSMEMLERQHAAKPGGTEGWGFV